MTGDDRARLGFILESQQQAEIASLKAEIERLKKK